MAMGAFIAGIMLADSSFRHELEADIEPFRGILLGLFFVAVGMSINVDSILYSWWRIALAVPVVMLIKAAVLYGLARLFKASRNDAMRIALLLPQAGEFAFVLFASASAVRALWPSETSLVAGIVTVTMALTPFSVMLGRYLIKPEQREQLEEDFEGAGGNVLVIGFGRFGQIVCAGPARPAHRRDRHRLRAPSASARQSRFGFRIYFGDGTRRDVLRAAGAEQATIICICVDKPDVDEPHRRPRHGGVSQREGLHARPGTARHTLELLAKGVDYEMRETYELALAFGADTLRGMGVDADDGGRNRRRRPAPRRRPAGRAA